MPARLDRALPAVLLALAACQPQPSPTLVSPEPVTADPRAAAATEAPEAKSPEERDTYAEAREVLESRCVVCHGCYDAPCQLKLDEPAGVMRGATKIPVYDGSRLTAVTPTRFGIDAQSIEQWQSLGFFPVVQTDATGAATASSTLLRLLELKREHPLPDGKLLPEDMPVDINREAVCASPDELDDFIEEHPTWGMPYALPGLAESEHASIVRWLDDGAPIPASAKEPDAVHDAVARWERFLNQSGNKAQLMSRYLYEHLFLATLQLTAADGDVHDYRIVRSVTPPGEPIEEMATRRPFDPPVGDTLYYRLRPWTAVRLSKTHMPYALNAARMQRWEAWFLKLDYEVDKLPGYGETQSANPFATFHAIPVRSRYSFLLDEAEFTLMGFIKGPVCRGQVALDVIQDQFWVTFVSPDSPLVKAEDEFLRENAAHLALPAGDGSVASPTSWLSYSRNQRTYLKKKSDFLAKAARSMKPVDLSIVWDGGEEHNPNAALTVFRHFDSASVSKGLLGAQPKTNWLLSYAVLERIHYLLVAGFDVFGNVGHQLNTRMYMDFLRMEAEHNFLLLLPIRARRPLVDDWYQDVSSRVKDEVYGRIARFPYEPAIAYETKYPKQELLSALKTHLHQALADTRPGLVTEPDAKLREPLEILSSLSGGSAQHFPEHAFLRVHDAPGGAKHYTVLRNSAHTNVAHLFREHARRKPEDDSLTVLPGFLGAYPNAFYEVAYDQLATLATRAASIQNAEDYEAFVDDFGMRRSTPGFWEYSDALARARRSLTSPEAGLLDYNRLENR